MSSHLIRSRTDATFVYMLQASKLIYQRHSIPSRSGVFSRSELRRFVIVGLGP